jgi:hypothetical protein
VCLRIEALSPPAVSTQRVVLYMHRMAREPTNGRGPSVYAEGARLVELTAPVCVQSQTFPAVLKL